MSTSTITLRPYQEEAHNKSFEAYEKGITKQLIVLFTGGGKTKLTVSLLDKYKEKHGLKKVLWLSFEEELVTQSAMAFIRDKFDASLSSHIEEIGFLNYMRSGGGLFALSDFKMGCLKADIWQPEGNIVMGSVLSLPRKIEQFPPDYWDIVVCDEAHKYGSASANKVLSYLKPKLLLGLTATPHRESGVPLSDIFEKIIFDYALDKGIKDGWSAEMDAVRIKTTTSLDAVRTVGGELNQGDLANHVNNLARNQQIVDSYRKYADGRKCIAFCVDIQHSIDLAEAFKNNGYSCEAISSNEERTPNRKGKLEDFKKNKIQILTNTGILVTGYDEPETGCIIMACPTKSLTKYLQCLDEKTEILTHQGWVGINGINKKHKVAGYNINSGEITWEKINKIYTRDRGENEEMYSISLPEIDIRVTGGHRMVVSNRVSSKIKYFKPYEFIEASQFSKRKDLSRIPISGLQKSKGLPLTNWELIFIGLFLSDGSMNKGKNQLYIAQSAHQKWNIDIVECLNNCGIEYKLVTKTRKTNFSDNSTVNYYYLRVGQFKHLLPWLDKKINNNYEQITPYQLEHLIHGINLGDGDKHVNSGWKRGTFGISTGNIDFCNNLQSLCVRKGFKCLMSRHKNNKLKLHIKPYKKNKAISFCNDGRNKFVKENNWKKERVWCVDNNMETLVIRRNGKVSIVGNCVGRGARLKPKEYVDRFGQNCKVIDVVDVTTRHSLINTWELDRKKPIEDRTFVTKENKEKLLEERNKPKAIITHTREKDEVVNLLKLPTIDTDKYGTKHKPASEKQLAWIQKFGYDIVNESYTMEQVSQILNSQQIEGWKLKKLKEKGYDITQGCTVAQYAVLSRQFEKEAQQALVQKYTPNNNGNPYF